MNRSMRQRLVHNLMRSALLVLSCIVLVMAIPACSDDDDDEGDDAALMTTGSDIDPDAIVSESRGLTYMMSRSSGSYTAKYANIQSGSGGGVSGMALHLFEGGRLVYARFHPFKVAVSNGNDFVTSGGLRADVVSEKSDADTESDGEGLTASGQEFTQENIRIVAAPNGSFYHLNIYVDGRFIVTLYKDCNKCVKYTKAAAVAAAPVYLAMLQGWTR